MKRIAAVRQKDEVFLSRTKVAAERTKVVAERTKMHAARKKMSKSGLWMPGFFGMGFECYIAQVSRKGLILPIKSAISLIALVCADTVRRLCRVRFRKNAKINVRLRAPKMSPLRRANNGIEKQWKLNRKATEKEQKSNRKR